MERYYEYPIVFGNDILTKDIGTKVCCTGIIFKKWKRPDGGFGIQIKDITSTIIISFSTDEKKYYWEQLIKGKRIRIFATVSEIGQKRCLSLIDHIDFLEELSLGSYGNNIMEQESAILISKISDEINNKLKELGFVKINTRIITRSYGNEILEPLLAKYPGYGATAFLSPSPSSQLTEFLAVTLLPRVFTETESITQSYRFPNGPTELPIIMAKAINLTKEDVSNTILGISSKIIKSLSRTKYELKIIKGTWDENVVRKNKYETNVFVYGVYLANIPAIGDKWKSVVDIIQRFEDDKGNVLAESAFEKINEEVNIVTITFYPSQYLNWLKKKHRRQLLNLWKIYEGRDIYV